LPPCTRHTGLPRIAGARQGSLDRRQRALQRGATRASARQSSGRDASISGGHAVAIPSQRAKRCLRHLP
jgi:hypothetical protein